MTAGLPAASGVEYKGNEQMKGTPNSAQVIEYLDFLNERIVEERRVPDTLKEWKKRRRELKEILFKLVGLDPLPEKTPLNPHFIGDPIEAEQFTFQRIVYESRPKNYVACHLYIPKKITFPAPAMIYAPSSTGRDNWKAIGSSCYYAGNGFVVLAMPLLGGEGRTGATLGTRGGAGPLLGKNFHWYSTGYQPLGVVIWDTIRAVDYLLSLKAPDGGLLVDRKRIGIAGHSQGSHRSSWGIAADERITASVPVCGWRPVWKYRLSLHRSSDEGVLYNYCGVTVAEIFSLAAPRKLRVVNGRTDKYFANPEGSERIARFVRKIYALYSAEERFDNRMFDQGHTYSSGLMKSEHTWINRWLRNGEPGQGVRIPDGLWKKERSRRGKRVLDEDKLRCFTGSSRKGLLLQGKPVEPAHTEMQFTPSTPVWKVADAEDFEQFKRQLTIALREEVLRWAFRGIQAKLASGDAKNRGDLREESMILTLDNRLSHRALFFYKNGERRKTIILLADDTMGKLKPQALKFTGAGANVLLLETTDIGATSQKSSKKRLNQLIRFAPQVGHTLSSLRVNDTLAAFSEISGHQAVDPKAVYVWGRGAMAVPALYAAVVDEKIAGVILEDAPDTHNSKSAELALLRILRHADIPQAAGLLFPRPVYLAGKQASGFTWTEKLYRSLNKSGQFLRFSGNINELPATLH